MKKEIDPRMHSAEHILSQTMIRLYNCGRPLSTHIEKKKSKCDYQFSRPLTEGETKEIQRRVNEIIQADLLVSEEFVGIEEAERIYDLKRLPAGAKNRVRVVRIGDHDVCPCIGPHVNSTIEVGDFEISSSSFENGVLRLRFKLTKS
jgi:Ser-tRNA(Ala) deacylase AlaX